MHNIDYSIVCCFYNESQVLNKKFEEFVEKTKKSPFSFEVIICDNNSNDGSYEFLKKMEKKKIQNFNFIFNSSNLGKGGSIKKCISLSRGKFTVIYDIDEYIYEDLILGNKILKENKQIDFLVGSRALKKKKFIYRKNYYGVRLLTQLINLFFKTNLTDAAGATKFFKNTIYKKLEVNTNGFDFEFDVLCKFAKLGCIIAEYPTQYFPRTFEEGKKLRAFKDGFMIFKSIIKNFLNYK